MGAWGTGVFENDDALDFLYELQDSEPNELMREVLSKSLLLDYLEAGDGERIIVCCALIDTIIHGTNYGPYSEEFHERVQQNKFFN